MLLAVSHESTAATFKTLPIEVSDAGIKLGAPTTLDAIAMPREGFYSTMLASDETSWVSAQREADAFKLTRHSYQTGASKSIKLDVSDITALMLSGDQLFVGAGRALGVVRWDTDDPKLKLIKDRSDTSGKAYDLFARSGEMVVAIDDMVMPMFAELLRLDAKGGWAHLESWELPGLVNGMYYGALLELDKDDQLSGRLYLLDAFSVITGTGQNLAALTMKQGKLSHGSDTILNSMTTDEPPVLEESTKRGESKPERVLAGETMTPWYAIAMAPGAAKIAIAAGERGLLLVPKSFTSASTAVIFDVGGHCLDVLSVEDSLLVLVKSSDGVGKLVELQAGKAGLEITSTTNLPAVFQRFVR